MNTSSKKVLKMIVVMIAVLILAIPLFAGEEKAKSEVKTPIVKEQTAAKWTDSFNEEKSDLVSTGKNPFFSLEPGYVAVYKGKEDGENAELKISVLNETKVVDGVETRIVEERETANGELTEISLNYFAISKRTNNVYYFGEESNAYKDGKVVSKGGSWESGVNGARYGLMMPAVPLLGAKYYQEVAPKEAMDRAKIVSISETMQVPAGKFENCLKTEETTPLEPDAKEYKCYAAGVGLLKDGDLELTEVPGTKTEVPGTKTEESGKK